MTTSPPQVKSCDTCPSSLAPRQQNTVIGSNIGGSVCGLKLIPIGRPGQETGKPAAELTASKCDRYGTEPDYDTDRSRRAAIKFPVAMPTPQGTPRDQDSVSSCRNCSNYVPGGVMMTASGWNAGFCRATGDLLLPDRLGVYAQGCPSRSFTHTPMPDAHASAARGLGLVFLPEFMDGYGKKNIIALISKNSGDAQSYESDRPVKPGEAKAGVKAWRLIEDPENFGPDLYLPIFAKDFFDEIDWSKVPKIGDQERPEDYLDHGGFVYKLTALWTELDETPAIWGEPGVGKTELLRYMAFLMSLPFERISITSSSEIDDLAGKPQYTPERGTYFEYGRIPNAWQRACVLGIDEPNTGPPDVWQFIRPLTDNSKQLVLDQNRGERIIRHAACFLGMAMNPAWDARNTGVSSLADADGSRLMHIFMGLPPRDIEERIIRRALERENWEEPAIKKAITQVMACVDDLRTLSAESVIPISWGIRSQLKVARAMKFFSPIQAYRIGAADFLEEAAQQAILDAVKSKLEE